jgi:glyoxylase-like metal-dependent hydrolase (beta-lactamase superfamily II)/ferredoxin
MADRTRRLPENAAGPLFVDASCIDCDACRQLAPATFAQRGSASAVTTQPPSGEQLEAALRALVACPVGAIGDEAHRSLADAVAAFPVGIDGPVSYLGFNARSSYGANAYLLEHPGGNWMIDSPRWNASLVRALERRGGLRSIFLTHRDDVADAARFAAHFGAQRIIHERDRQAMPDAEIILAGDEAITFDDLTVIPTPGHTRGHCVLHYGAYLFSGDHVAWDRDAGTLTANPDVCWYDWPTQVRSVARLADWEIAWILPGHGERVQLAAPAMRAALRALAAGSSHARTTRKS